MPTCGTIVPFRRAQKCPLNRIRRSHVAQLRSHVSRFRSHDFLFRSHKRQMRSEKATLLPCPWGNKHLYILLKFRKFCPHALNQRSPARSGKVKGVLGNFSRTVQTFSGVDGWHRQVVGRRGSLCRSWWWRCWCVPKPWR